MSASARSQALPIAGCDAAAGDAVPLMPNLRRAQESRVMVGPDMDPAAVEQYRRLAAVLHNAQVHTGIRTLMVASALPGEGKTLTMGNLAVTLSHSFQRRVVLVDADLRRPAAHELFQIPNAAGLNEALQSGAWKPPMTNVSERLSLLTAGRPNPDPMGALTSDAMRQLIQDLGASFDWVLIDTPPVGLMPDAHLLAGMADAAVLVIAAGRAPCRLVELAVSALGHDRIIGVVLNRIDKRAVGQTYGYNASQYYGYLRK